MLFIFQLILCYHAWLKRDTYWVRGDTMAQGLANQAVRTMIVKLQELWPRLAGLGWHLTKLHKQVHVPLDIERFGRHQNVHSGPQEHNHIKNVKDVAKQAQQRASVIDRQTGERLYERHVVEAGYYFVRELMTTPCSPVSESIHSATKGTVVFTCDPGAGSHIEAWVEWGKNEKAFYN